MYADDEPQTMWAWTPLSNDHNYLGLFSLPSPCRCPFTQVEPKEWIRMWNIYVTSIIIIVWCLSHPVTLTPLSQPALDAAMPIITRVAFQLGRHVSNPITLQYLQRNYHVVKNASLVLALGYFDEAVKHVSGGTGWSVAIAQVLNKPLYVFDLNMEHWYWWYPTLQQYQHCEGMTEEHVSLPTLQDKTAIVGTREEV